MATATRESRPTICRFCFNACGVLVDCEDDQPVRVRGDEDNLYNFTFYDLIGLEV